MSLEDGAFDTLSHVANGDLRKAITLLQSAVRLKGAAVSSDTVLDVAGAVPQVGFMAPAPLEVLHSSEHD